MRAAERAVLDAVRELARARGVVFGRVGAHSESATAKVRGGRVEYVEVAYLIHPADHDRAEEVKREGTA